jgi:hypothetical protein
MGTRRHLRTATALATTACLTLAAGCGGGSSGDDTAKDKAAITAVLTKAITSNDPEVMCVETVTPAFVTRVYKTVAACRKAEAPKPSDSPKPTGAKVTDVEVKDGKATASVTAVGGDTDGAHGTIDLAKDSGAWKVEDLSVEFLRSQLAQGFANATFTADDGPLTDPAFRACLTKQLDALDDVAFKAVAYNAIAETETDPRFLKAVTTCQGETSTATGSGDVPAPSSKVREQFEGGLRQSAEKDGTTTKTIDCIILKLRKTISDDEIIEAARSNSNTQSADNPITKKVAAAISSC